MADGQTDAFGIHFEDGRDWITVERPTSSRYPDSSD
jgi:hypothetical protein